VARQEATEKSDIDLFFDTSGKNIERKINNAIKEFYNSVKYKKYWELKGVKNEIKATIGRLEDWEELKVSVVSNGVVLYGKFEEIPDKGKLMTLFVFENIEPETKRAELNKKLFGYIQRKRKYPGLIEKTNSKRLGKGCIYVSQENSIQFEKLFKGMKIPVKIKKVLEY